MDINSLLSPDSNPKSGNSTPVPGPTSNNAPTPAAGPSPHKVIQRTRSGPARKGKTSSPLAQQVYAPTGIPEASSTTGTQNLSGNGAPATDLPPQLRQASTPGMDTLADLAALQHHQPQRQNAASMLRSTESYGSQLSPSTIHPHVNPINHNTPTPRTSFDIAMSEGPRENARRGYGQTSLDPDAQRLATEAFNQIQENPHIYDAHVKFIGILHTGFVNHVYPPNQPGIHGDPRRYDLLKDLRIAREEMDKLFAMGQDLWAEWIADETLLAHTVNERIAVMELCQRSVEEEFGSTELWKIYGDWVLHLYKEAHEHGPGQWTEEDRMIGREVFSWQSVLDVWQRAAEATQWMINDVDGVWDRLLEVLDNDINRASPNSQERIGKINHLRGLWDIRLQTPHAEWDRSFQKFSGFISTHYGPANYEEIMAKTVACASEAKGLYEAREKSEAELRKAQETGDKALEWTAYSEYIETELSRKRGRRNGFHAFNFELVNAVYQRAVLRFPTDVSLWEDYVMFLIDQAMHGHASTTTIATLDRATRHCPWSGNLWSQYLLSSEREGQSFSKISNIKHKATSTGLLDAGGMEEVLKVHTTWCSYLRRRAFFSDSTDEDLDVAQVGILSAMESVQELGEKKYGQSYQGDPLFRLERIYIRYLSESGSWDSAREKFKDLVPRRGNSYEFWLVYYGWELICWRKFVLGESTVDAARRTPSPSYATAVLKQAIKRTDLDWPEKIVQTYIAHCEDYEDSDELQLAVIATRKARRAVNSRRENEAREAAAAQELQQKQQWEAAAEIEASSSEKRKREEDEIDANHEPTNKKVRSDDTAPDQLAATSAAPVRDRENATVVAKNLPQEATELQVRQFFRNYGTINSVKMVPSEDKSSQTVHIEFETREDALGALARDQKLFNDNTIQVQIASSSTLWVTNFPPATDENFIRELFAKYGNIVDVRFPSLKFQTSRRFCYVQFSSSSAALQATELDNTELEKNYKLVVKISDPTLKQSRKGPMEEGREIFCRNLDFKQEENDIEELFLRFGTVENVYMPRTAEGRSKGFCFVVFSMKEEAEAALSMNNEIFGSRPLLVQKSTNTGAKRMTNTIISHVASSSRSPSVEVNGSDPVHTVGDRRERTFALMNVPDTVNEARIRALVEPFGRLIKLSLRPDHQGAIVEYTDVQDAGKAALALEGKEIVPGRAIHIGKVSEMMSLKADKKTDRITSIKPEKPKTTTLQPAGPIKRPQQPGARGGRRGGLGQKRAITGSTLSNDKMDTTSDDKDIDSGKPKKSNDDFRALLQQKREE